MVVSASRRTDIPAFYGEWLMNRLRAGEVLVRNPFSPARVRRIALTPEEVDCIVFWTKDPMNLLRYLPEIDRAGYRYYFLFTLTPYDSKIETNVRQKSHILRTFRDLSCRIGPDRIVWRYDPIVFTPTYDLHYHVERYRFLAEHLSSYTQRCIISFLEMYKKVQRNMKDFDVGSPTTEAIYSIAGEFSEIAERNKIQLLTCSTNIDLSRYGIGHSKCIDDELIGKLLGRSFVGRKDPSQRRDCGCIESADIGSYNTCLHGCRYCYANENSRAVGEKRRRYDALSSALCDSVERNEAAMDSREPGERSGIAQADP